MFTRTQEGEFAFFSPGRNVGWRLVKDSEDPGKREWELVNPSTGEVLRRHTGVLTLGGRPGAWIQGIWENMSQLHKENVAARQEYAAEMIAKGYYLDKRGRWKLRRNAESNEEIAEVITEEVEEVNTGENNELPSFTREISEDELNQMKEDDPEAFADTDTTNTTSNNNELKINGDTTGTTTKDETTIRPMSVIEQRNRERFGDAHVDALKQKQIDFKRMQRGELTKDQFINLYPNSQVAIRHRNLLTKLRIR